MLSADLYKIHRDGLSRKSKNSAMLNDFSSKKMLTNRFVPFRANTNIYL